MREDRDASEQVTAQDNAVEVGRQPGRRHLKAAVIVALVVAVLGLVVFYAPRYVARHLVVSELERLGISYEGVDTLDINPWTGEGWLGPVAIGVGPSAPAQLGYIDLDLSFNPLLDRRISIARLLLRDIDFVVTRSKDDVIALNGIPISQFIPPPAAAEQTSDDAVGWGAGLDVLELRDSRLVFEDRERGDVEVVVERLTMSDFRTWEPDRPGRFELVAKVNDIQLNWSGEARPFADRLTLAIESRTKDADVPKVVRFTGPLGLDRREGSYDANLKYEVALSENGRVEGHTAGTIDIKGADYQRAGIFGLAFERAEVNLDVRYILNESGDFALQGRVDADLGKNSATVGDETSFGATGGRLTLNDLDASYMQDGRLAVAARPDLDLDDVTFSGPVEISVDQLLELLALLQSLSAGADASTADTGLGDLAGGSVTAPYSDVTLGRLRSQGGSFSLESDGGEVALSMQANSDLSDIQIVVDERTIRIESVRSLLRELKLKSGKGKLAFDMKGGNSLVSASSVSPIGELKVGALDSETDAFALRVETGAVSAEIAAAAKVSGVSARLNAREGLPEAKFQLGAANAALSQASIDASDGAARWQLVGGAAIDSLSAEFAGGEQGAFKFARAEIKALQLNHRSELVAEAFTLDGLDIYMKRSLLQALLGPGQQGTQDAESAQTEPPKPAASPGSDEVAQEVDVRRVQTLLANLDYAPGAVDGQMGGRTTAAIEAFQRHEGLAVDGSPTARLLAALEARVAGTSATASTPPSQVSTAQDGGSGIRLGQLSLTGKTVVRFRDDVVTPHVNVDTVFKEFLVRKLDTRRMKPPGTDVRISAEVNEFTQVELTGSINGFSENADIDVNAKVENLELSNFSPYIEELAGVYLESGHLDTLSAGKATQGVLQGEIQLGLEKITFRPLSAEDAARMSGKVGVPLETAVNLLQDNDGRIALKLPVTGTLSEPDVDISSAVNKAIGGALKKVFPPTMVASFLSGVSKGGGASFESIVFAPGSAELDAAGRSYADDLAKFLAERPRLLLNVCGRSTSQDMGKIKAVSGAAKSAADKPEEKAASGTTKPAPAGSEPGAGSAQLAQQLKELAGERKSAVRRYLINEKGTDAKRVGECRSSFDAADTGAPRVEILL